MQLNSRNEPTDGLGEHMWFGTDQGDIKETQLGAWGKVFLFLREKETESDRDKGISF